MADAGEGVRIRADARRNRERILAAAADLFVEQGLNIPMEEIARRADVGVGTLYRRFPDRDSLIHAVAVTGFRALADAGEEALAAEPTAWLALVRYVRHCGEFRLCALRTTVEDRAAGVGDAADSRDSGNSESADGAGCAEFERARRDSVDVLDRMVRGAQADGAMRADVTAADVGTMISLLSHQLAGVPADAYRRYIDVLLDGFRAGSGGIVGASG